VISADRTPLFPQFEAFFHTQANDSTEEFHILYPLEQALQIADTIAITFYKLTLNNNCQANLLDKLNYKNKHNEQQPVLYQFLS